MSIPIIAAGLVLIVAALAIYSLLFPSKAIKTVCLTDTKFSSVAASLKEIRAILEERNEQIKQLNSDLGIERQRAATAITLARHFDGRLLSLENPDKKSKKGNK